MYLFRKSYWVVFSFLCFCPVVSADFHSALHLSHEENPMALARADDIFHKCKNKAKRIVDERVCESEKAAIRVCMKSEMKEKDVKAAQSTCERLFLM